MDGIAEQAAVTIRAGGITGWKGHRFRQDGLRAPMQERRRKKMIAELHNSAIIQPAMDEIIMLVVRAVACMARLRILSRLAHKGELAPTSLARDLQMPLQLVCTHLRRLTATGLIQRRRSGVWSYGVARSPYGKGAFSSKLAAWLFETLKDPTVAIKHCRVAQLRNLSAAQTEAQLHAIIFEAATAFTNVRRLQILRRLTQGGQASVKTLTAGLRMSESAVSRHMGKLIRRGYVAGMRSGHSFAYNLAKQCKTPVHDNFLKLVRAEWKKK